LLINGNFKLAKMMSKWIGLMVILALATHFGAVDAITCYTSVSAVVVGVSTNTQIGCTSCQKTVLSVPFFNDVVTKSCVSTCVPSSVTTVGAVYCCSTELCNGAGAARVSLVGAAVASLCALWAMRR